MTLLILTIIITLLALTSAQGLRGSSEDEHFLETGSRDLQDTVATPWTIEFDANQNQFDMDALCSASQGGKRELDLWNFVRGTSNQLANDFLKNNGYPVNTRWSMLHDHDEHRPDRRHRSLFGGFTYSGGVKCSGSIYTGTLCDPDDSDGGRRELGSSNSNGKSLSDYVAKGLKSKLRQHCGIKGLREVTMNADQ